MGWPTEKAASRDAMLDPAGLVFFIRFAQELIDYEWRPPAKADMESQKERKT